MSTTSTAVLAAVLGAATLLGAAPPQAPPATPPAAPRTQVVMLGTGNPPIDPDRSGPATAIVVGDTAYLVDFGAGVVRRAKSAAVDKGIAALDPVKLRVAFVTHLHSDHTVGYADLILTPWVVGRRFPLEVYGPKGIKEMTAHILQAYQADFDTRLKDRHIYARAIPEARAVTATDVKPGVVYKDANVTVTAFETDHTMESYGYRFDTPDRRIVISGDTAPTQATIDACSGCDVLIHEVLTQEWLGRRPDFQKYASLHHTSTTQLVELATKAKPKLLVLYHASLSWRPAVDSERSAPAAFLREMASYAGQVVVARDLDVY